MLTKKVQGSICANAKRRMLTARLQAKYVLFDIAAQIHDFR
jgi:hypothetical protein